MEISGSDETGIDFVLVQAPGVEIEKLTNGIDADKPNGGDAPEIVAGVTVEWTYEVTNTGGGDLVLLDVTDNQGVSVTCPPGNLVPDQTVVCTGSAAAVDLRVVPGVEGNCAGRPGSTLYQGIATVQAETVNGAIPVEDEDASHYCNPLWADMVISKTDNQDDGTPGGSTTYTIVASNNGPDAVADANVVDNYPASLSCSYTSVVAGGASGNTADGSGDIDDTLVLPAGSSVTYTAVCDIDPAASGELSNTATISSGANDPSPGDESATDSTSLTYCDYTVSQPDGGELWRQGETHSINWSASGNACAPTVDIELLKGGVLDSTIASGTSDIAFDWNIPKSQTTGDDYSVRVVDTGNAAFYGESTYDFTIDVATCNVNIVSGVTEYSSATHEACEILALGPDFVAEGDASVRVSAGWEIEFLPGFSIATGASMSANTCGQSLCMTSESPMPYGCHSCVDQICDSNPECCDDEFSAACLEKVESVCNLVCEAPPE